MQKDGHSALLVGGLDLGLVRNVVFPRIRWTFLVGIIIAIRRNIIRRALEDQRNIARDVDVGVFIQPHVRSTDSVADENNVSLYRRSSR